MEISQKIIDYAIWYYLRYYPSRKKLSQKLDEKFGTDSKNGEKYGGISKKEIDFILDEKLRNIINEKEVLKAKIKNLKNKGKNLSYIKGNLIQKGFILYDLEDILEKDFNISKENFLEKEVLKRKIKNLKDKGKSKNFIKQKFIERNLDKDLVENLLEKIFLDGEVENLIKEYEKIKEKFDRKKIIEKLLRKGFLYDDIKKVLEK